MNWEERIKIAEACGAFTKEDRSAADNWVTCACGEQDPRIERDWVDAPLDPALFTLGEDFMEAVDRDDFDGARQTLRLIEARAAELIAEHEREETEK